jgi:hypothetical protein
MKTYLYCLTRKSDFGPGSPLAGLKSPSSLCPLCLAPHWTQAAGEVSTHLLWMVSHGVAMTELTWPRRDSECHSLTPALRLPLKMRRCRVKMDTNFFPLDSAFLSQWSPCGRWKYSGSHWSKPWFPWGLHQHFLREVKAGNRMECWGFQRPKHDQRPLAQKSVTEPRVNQEKTPASGRSAPGCLLRWQATGVEGHHQSRENCRGWGRMTSWMIFDFSVPEFLWNGAHVSHA